MSTLKRGCLALVIVVVVVVVGGFVYLQINPPFALPETGYLSASETVELRLGPSTEPRAYRLRVEPSDRIYDQRYAPFPPARITATVAGESGAGSTSIEVLPASGPALHLPEPDQPGSAAWGLDCDGDEVDTPCIGEYVLVVRPNASSSELETTLEIFAEQEFPPHVPNPFLAGIGIGLERIELPPSRSFETDADSHTATVAPDAPVAVFDVEIETPADAVLAGATLIVSAERLEPAIPVGPEAPPPVRVALIDGGNRIVADVGPRPGTSARFALPSVQGDYRIVAWWQDYADQSYEITWEVEVGAVADSGRPRVDGAPRPAAGPSETLPSSGEVTVGDEFDTEFVHFGIERDADGRAEPGHLPPTIGVLYVTLEMTEHDGGSPLLLLIGAGSGSSGPQIPIALRIGEPVEFALGATLDCSGWQCGQWGGHLTDPADTQSPGSFLPAKVRWDSELVVWPLEPNE